MRETDELRTIGERSFTVTIAAKGGARNAARAACARYDREQLAPPPVPRSA